MHNFPGQSGGGDRATAKLAELYEAEAMKSMIKDNLGVLFPGIETQLIMHQDSNRSLTVTVIKKPTEKDIELTTKEDGGRYFPTVLVLGKDSNPGNELMALSRLLDETRWRVAEVIKEAVENGFASEGLQL